MESCCIILLAMIVLGNSDTGDGNAEELDWWQTTVIYQIYPRSFKDSNNDGIGDLKGIEEKAEYLKELGIDTVWLSPVFKSPMADMGYDISDFKAIDPLFGTMDDFISLQKKFHKLGIRLTLDFVPNHTSDEHEWFQKSIKKVEPYTDYYVWKDPKSWINETTPEPPNNWISIFQGSAWTYNPERKQFYLHQFAAKQPDLNYRSAELLEEMKSTLRFWLDKGVHGFRTDAVPYLVEHSEFRDEPIIGSEKINGLPLYDSMDHVYTTCQSQTYDVIREFRNVLDSYKNEKKEETRLLMTEVYASLENTMKFYGNTTHPLAHITFNFFLINDFNDSTNARDLARVIHKWMDQMSEGKWPNWVLGNHDNPRITNKFDTSSVDALNMLLLLLPGTAITYNGEEIGMENTKIRWDQTTDIRAINVGPQLYTTLNRDPERTPFQWDTSIHAGFSKINGKTWLPLNPNYYRLNVEIQKNDPKSHYNIYRELIKLRSKQAFRSGELETYEVSQWVFAFKRNSSSEVYIVVINLGSEEELVNLRTTINDIAADFNIILASSNSEHNVGDKFDASHTAFQMRPKSALVLQKISK